MSEEMSPELKAKMSHVKMMLKCIERYPETLKGLEGEMIPYNVIKKINRVFDLYPISLVMAASLAIKECEEMGY